MNVQPRNTLITTTEPGFGSQSIRRVIIAGNSINGDPQPGIVTAAVVADATAGQVTAGTHVYGVSFVTASGESQASPVSVPVTADGTHTKVAVSNIPVGPTGVTSRKLYRSAAGLTALKVLATIADNTTTTYTDIIPDASLGASPPSRGASNSGDGMYLRGRLKDVEVRGNEISGMGLSGIHLEASNGAPSEVKIDGNRVWDNGYRAAGGNQNGVLVEAGCDQVHIVNNRMYDSGAGTQTIGVNNTGTASNLVVEGNRINATTPAVIAAATTGYVQGRGGYTLTDGATVTPDTLKGDVAHWTIAANAARTVAAPTGIGATTGSRFTLVVKNGIGGATAFTAANLTFNATFLKNGAFPATNIADTKTRTISFEYNGANWVETGRVDADRYQHPDTRRGERSLPWIKDFTNQINELAYRNLSYADRGLLHSLREMYALNRGDGIEMAPRSLNSLLGQRVSNVQVERLNHAGFITLSASKTLASRKHDASLDKDRDKEEDRDKNQDQEPNPTPPVANTLPPELRPQPKNGSGGGHEKGIEPIGQTAADLLSRLRGAA